MFLVLFGLFLHLIIVQGLRMVCKHFPQFRHLHAGILHQKLEVVLVLVPACWNAGILPESGCTRNSAGRQACLRTQATIHVYLAAARGGKLVEAKQDRPSNPQQTYIKLPIICA